MRFFVPCTELWCLFVWYSKIGNFFFILSFSWYHFQRCFIQTLNIFRDGFYSLSFTYVILLRFYFVLFCASVLAKSISVGFKGCVCYVFASLFSMSKREHFWNKKKYFFFHFESCFHSWDNQILTFHISTCHDVMKCLSMKHETHFTE